MIQWQIDYTALLFSKKVSRKQRTERDRCWSRFWVGENVLLQQGYSTSLTLFFWPRLWNESRETIRMVHQTRYGRILLSPSYSAWDQCTRGERKTQRKAWHSLVTFLWWRIWWPAWSTGAVSDVHEIFNRYAAQEALVYAGFAMHDGIWDLGSVDMVYGSNVADLSPNVTQVHDILWA